MAAELVENPEAVQTVEHDIESIFWVLLWMCLLYMDTNMDVGMRSSVIKDTMSPRVYANTGGSGKVDFLANRHRLDVLKTPTSPPVATLLKSLHEYLYNRYRSSSPSLDVLPFTLSQREARIQSKT
jgi:hypothetical protein